MFCAFAGVMPLAAIDLITPSLFIDAWSTAGVNMSAADINFLPTLVTAASDGIQRFLGRWLVLRDYIEIRQPLPGQWDKPDADYIGLSWFPNVATVLNPVCSVRTNRQTALSISNQNLTSNQDASFLLLTIGDPNFGLPQPCGIRVGWLSSGTWTYATFPFFGTPTSAGFNVTASGTGGSIPAGTYQCAYSNVNVAGESVPSAAASVTVATGQNLVFTIPTLVPYATGNNVYVSTTNGGTGTMTVQNSAVLSQTSFTLSALVSGAAAQTGNYGTLGQIGTAINNLGNGWQVQTQGSSQNFALWPSWDCWASNGTEIGCLNTGYQQGVDVFSTRMVGVQLDQSSGSLYLPKGATQYGSGPGNITQWPGSADILMGGANWNGPVLLRYGAGFATIPYAVQDACILLVKAMFERYQTSSTLKRQDSDRYKREAFEMVPYLPAPVKKALGPFRQYGV